MPAWWKVFTIDLNSWTCWPGSWDVDETPDPAAYAAWGAKKPSVL